MPIMMPNQPSEFTDEGGKSELQAGTPGHAPPSQTMHKYHTYHFPRSPNYASLSTAARVAVRCDRSTPLFFTIFSFGPIPTVRRRVARQKNNNKRPVGSCFQRKRWPTKRWRSGSNASPFSWKFGAVWSLTTRPTALCPGHCPCFARRVPPKVVFISKSSGNFQIFFTVR
ncbi:LAFE_0E12574g1_1 [Lachancea fermentati]|uniref:LAFE_0E12574g1_1 n=1 Tax=Lachancea fermentati TaxID=4955 RepID=A0A1G4ME63_LACFM|nr:LAFE_0E12574g1_1 [Lachancea fermentati]